MMKYILELEYCPEKSYLEKLFPNIDVSNFIFQLKDMGLLSIIDNVEKNHIENYNANYKNRKIIINFIYSISCLLGIFNLIHLISRFKEIMILDINYYGSAINLFILIFIANMVLGLIHEFGHSISAKLSNVKSEIKISQRFIIFLVYECKMDGIWLLDNKKRIFPILGGMLIDNVVIFILSILNSFFSSNIFNVLLFLQYTKLMYELIIPFKTDLYYLLTFCLNNKSNKEKLLHFFNFIGYIILIPLIFIYLYQVYNIYLYIINNKSRILENVIVVLIILLPIVIYIKERLTQHE